MIGVAALNFFENEKKNKRKIGREQVVKLEKNAFFFSKKCIFFLKNGKTVIYRCSTGLKR